MLGPESHRVPTFSSQTRDPFLLCLLKSSRAGNGSGRDNTGHGSAVRFRFQRRKAPEGSRASIPRGPVDMLKLRRSSDEGRDDGDVCANVGAEGTDVVVVSGDGFRTDWSDDDGVLVLFAVLTGDRGGTGVRDRTCVCTVALADV